MNEMPLHPALVHLPVALAFLMPIVTLIAFYFVKKSQCQKSVWIILLIGHLMLTMSAMVAMKTGEVEEEKVEKVVQENYLEEHEEAAEFFTYYSLALIFVCVVFIWKTNLSQKNWPYFLLFLMQLFAVAMAVRVGELGGELVYKHGAANAYMVLPGETPTEVIERDQLEEELMQE